VADKYAASLTQFDDTTVRYLNTLLGMMRNLLDGQEKFDEPALSNFQTSSSAI
jgi:hypothetical protein